MKKSKTIINDLLSSVDVKINGNDPWDIKVSNERFYDRVFSSGVLGLGESYMDGWWNCDDISELFFRILRSDIQNKIRSFKMIFPVAKARVLNLHNKAKAFRDVGSHYNKGNILFKNMLDKRLNYSCAYWKNAKTLDDAQEAKLELICRKIGLKPKMKILDIGCGWGAFVKYAFEKYDAESLGITLSEEQVKLGGELCKGLPIEIRLQDYREVKGSFDRIVSIGMIEHVGYKNYRRFMRVVSSNLKDDGLFLLHTIGSNNSDMCTDAWTNKYIFPNGMLPSIRQLSTAAENIFVVEDFHNFGYDYSKTLDAWYENFNRSWSDELSKYYDDRFYRMWKYFLLSFSGSFRARYNQVWQIVFSKKGILGGYNSLR